MARDDPVAPTVPGTGDGQHDHLDVPPDDAAQRPPDDLGPDPGIPIGRRTFWNVVLGIDLLLIAGLAIANLGQGLLLGPLRHTELGQQVAEETGRVTAAGIWMNSLGVFVLFGVIPFLWAYGTRGRKAFEYLRLRGRSWEPALGAGIGLALVVVLAIVTALYVWTTEGPSGLSGAGEIDSEVTKALVRVLTLPLALGIAASAALGEEVFFRGFLQRKVGWVWQGVLFGLVHAGYGTAMQVIGPFGIGLLFGFLVRRGLGLWTVMTAHFVYNLTQLLIVLWAKSQGHL